MNKALLLRFIELKIKAKEIDNEIEFIKEQTQKEVEAIIGEGAEQVALQEYPRISLSLAKARPKWEYSANVRIQAEALKELQKIEEQTGKAINLNEGKRELRFNQPKE